jgi:hypothetical protein
MPFMPNKMNKSKQKKGNKSGSGSGSSDNFAVGKLIPWDPTISYSDSLSLPKLPSTLYDVIISREVGAYLSSSTSAEVFKSDYVSLGQFPAASNFSTLFDQFRIMMVEVILMPQSSVNNTPTASYGAVASVLDYNDANNLSSFQFATTYDNVIVSEGYQRIRRCFRPRIALAAYTGAFGGFVNSAAQWLDISATAVQHYGFKYVWRPSSVVASYDAYIRIHVQFRNAY